MSPFNRNCRFQKGWNWGFTCFNYTWAIFIVEGCRLFYIAWGTGTWLMRNRLIYFFLYSSQCSKSPSMTRSPRWKTGRQVQCTVAVPWDGINLFYEHLAEVFFESDCYPSQVRVCCTQTEHGGAEQLFSNNASARLIPEPDAFKTCTSLPPNNPLSKPENFATVHDDPYDA